MENSINKTKQNKMGVMPVGRLMFGMAVPLVVSMLVQAFYNVVDSFFVARIGNSELEAVSLAYPIQMLMISVSVGTAVGMNAYISRKLGAGDNAAANKGAANGIMLLFISSLVFVILSFVIRPFFRIFTGDATLVDLGVRYLRICMLFCPGLFIQLGLERILQSMGKNGLAMLTQLLGAITNIILDPLLIFGIGPFPQLGVEGAAIATVIGQWLAMGLALVLVLGKSHEVRLSYKNFRPCGETVREIYRVGVPSIILQAIGSVMNIGMNTIFSRVLAGEGGGVAIMGVYFKVQSLIFMPIFGVTNASMSIIAYNYGAKNRLRLIRAWKLTLMITLAVMFVGMVVFQIFPDKIIALFDKDGSITSGGKAAFRIVSLSFMLAAASITNSITFGALGRGSASMVMSILRQLGVLLPAALILALTFKKVEAVWWSFFIAEFAALAFSLFMLRRVWKKDISHLPDGASV
ncbi:MAG: MATE family efflux transporter [Clostridia bacterium]|nr:MATE family efflux transporter [Clostridia bacterium]MBR5948912.1 MATE family efflux transporter [Clostridia bacterium]